MIFHTFSYIVKTLEGNFCKKNLTFVHWIASM